MRDVAASAEIVARTHPNGAPVVAIQSARTSGTVQAGRTLFGTMPICRIQVPPPATAPQREKVRVSDYVISRRIPPRSANDNRRPRGTHGWQWAAAIVAAPALTAMLLFSGLF